MSKTLDELFEEVAADQRAQAEKDEADPAVIARRDAQRKADLERETRQGLRDANGDWIEQPEIDSETMKMRGKIMNEMIERAANELANDIARFKVVGKVGEVFTSQDMVRSVIKAIREPTEAMVKAGNKHTDWADGADEAWKSMVDIILEEKA